MFAKAVGTHTDAMIQTEPMYCFEDMTYQAYSMLPHLIDGLFISFQSKSSCKIQGTNTKMIVGAGLIRTKS